METNDVVNPAAKEMGSALYGMPVLEAEKGRNAIVIRRDRDSLTKLVQEIKKL